MWAEACEMLDRAERLHRQFFRPGPEVQRGATWEPPIDIYETEHELAIIVALPGVDPSHIEVAVDGDMLRVLGTRQAPAFASGFVIHRLEIPYGRFERRIRLENGSLELTRREAVNGCLLLVFAKHP
ncbi:MAG: Hsp20/alpha crystallin family protein [Rhodospirillales bacterium]|nr:Hsp20/alpha crystallin family protein [Rhodospirillales bacterium]